MSPAGPVLRSKPECTQNMISYAMVIGDSIVSLGFWRIARRLLPFYPFVHSQNDRQILPEILRSLVVLRFASGRHKPPNELRNWLSVILHIVKRTVRSCAGEGRRTCRSGKIPRLHG